MKQSEIGILAVIVVLSIVAASFVGETLLSNVRQKGVSVQTEARISQVIAQPDNTVFNAGAKNPTVPITIGGNSGTQPLSGGQ